MTAAFPPVKTAALKNGFQMTYREQGSGSAVIFLHGSGPGASGQSNFKLNYPVIAAEGYRCIIPDMIGFGGSSKPSDIPYLLDMFRDTLIEFLGVVGVKKCTIVGNSLGGGIAMAVALKQPELVEKLVLMAPGGIESRWTYFRMPAMRKMVSGFVGGLDRDGLGRLLSMLLYDTKHATPELIDERLEVLKTQPKEVLSTMRVQDMSEDLPKLTCPILGFWGVDDEFNPVSGAMKIVSACPNARMTLIAKCGHWVMVEYADRFNRDVIDFLKHG
jgi:4,5:9,10-diseco-3-hydroxy-5,9,17-trioxoandrosta-1(10),2-diene-4-oate hydrolase